ncbi:MAG TPA: hypothetical protein VFM18_20665 [Methanosarcina sp.]|nr:hypothetical protein [Methanosarcina sp.]
MDKITRKEAIEQGLTHYYTGKPCKNGHDSIRFVVNCCCAACIKEWMKNDRKLIKQRRIDHETSNQEDKLS